MISVTENVGETIARACMLQPELWRGVSLRHLGAQAFEHPAAGKFKEHPLHKIWVNSLGQAIKFSDGVLDLDSVLSFALKNSGVSAAALQSKFENKEKEFADFRRNFDSVAFLDSNVAVIPRKNSPDNVHEIVNSLSENGVLISVATGAKPARPIVIVHAFSGNGGPRCSATKCFVDVDENAVVELIEVYAGGGKIGHLALPETTVRIAAGAKVNHVKLQLCDSGMTLIDYTDIGVHQNASYRSCSMQKGAKVTRMNLNVSLLGSRASADLSGLYLASKDQLVDAHTVIDHRYRDTRSTQNFRGLLTNNGKGVFCGKVSVRHNAPGSSARQSNKNLLLSAEAEVSTRPQLEIDNSEVECSHGATVSRPSESELFYLQSRAIARDQAEKILARGFVGEIFEQMPSEKLKSFLYEEVDRQIAGE